ncbi:MAG: hypothetical protein LUI01_07170 [Firmicutes bacterium]|nr:hypothetical protein [Bacillota bacterium]
MKTANRRTAALILALVTALMFVPSCMDAVEEDKTSGTENAAIEANTTGETSADEITEKDEADDAAENAETAENAGNAEIVETAETEITATFTNGVYSGDIAAFELGITFDDGGDNGVHSSDFSLWADENTSRYKRENAEETYSITFDGVTYTGTYYYTALLRYTTFEIDCYRMDSGWFSVKTNRGELVEFFYIADEGSGTGAYTLEGSQSTAEALASQYFDTTAYELETSEDDYWNVYSYTVYAGGIATRDTVNIGVSKYTGKVEIFSSADLGAFSSDTASMASLTDSASALKSENAAAALEAKLDAIYDEYESYEITYQTLAKLPSGDACLISNVSVKIKEEDEHMVVILLCEASSVTE